ncbi:zinc-binding dehydrogenase [Larkinella terrae]|uniref:Zinc-binding dehydrogenase n=1 Tax=Larkinella terrae TaxID=2025311 RepID=A0A7K0EVM9_9BACT|nr:zinc-binding dehydrogenase [Larkinella terrae]MRS65880.1 zinc-binding dehydrogenase [Larkinella terrae]
MKAIFQPGLHEFAQYIDMEKPVAGPGEAIVQIKAAAINHRDVYVQHGLYPKMKLPVVLGSDGAGVVVELGEGVDPAWKNEEVIINPALNWGPSPHFYGPDFKILGMPDNGTFAEYVKIEVKYLHRKPQHLSFQQAAALPLTGLTAWRALMTRAGLAQNPTGQPERVLITGIGGGGALAALQFAKAAGAEVWVTSGSAEKLQRAQELGATGGINYREADWAKTLLAQTGGGKGGFFDVIIDSAAGPGFAKLVDVAAPGGRIVFYGGTTGNITDVAPSKVFFKQLNIHGTTMGTEAEFADMVRFVEKHQLVPVIDEIMPLAEAELALRKIESGKQFGKLVLQVS